MSRRVASPLLYLPFETLVILRYHPYVIRETGIFRVPDSSTAPNSLEYSGTIDFDGREACAICALRKAYQNESIIRTEAHSEIKVLYFMKRD
jgi:hypothetical protein